MEVILDVPIPKYARGQVIEIKGGKKCPCHLFVHIINASAVGRWSVRNGVPVVELEGIRYVYTYQEGSRNAKGGLIRPGTVGSQDQSLENNSVQITWDKPIVSSDTDDNLSQRVLEWNT